MVFTLIKIHQSKLEFKYNSMDIVAVQLKEKSENK